MDFYADADLVTIVNRSARLLGVSLDPAGATEIASRSRGTPRVANRLLRRVRDYAQVHGHPVIDRATAHAALDLYEVDAIGLDRLDRAVKLVGFVNSTADFTDQPKVINGASDFMVAVLGDAGRHARSAVSAASLPLGVAVETQQFA